MKRQSKAECGGGGGEGRIWQWEALIHKCTPPPVVSDLVHPPTGILSWGSACFRRNHAKKFKCDFLFYLHLSSFKSSPSSLSFWCMYVCMYVCEWNLLWTPPCVMALFLLPVIFYNVTCIITCIVVFVKLLTLPAFVSWLACTFSVFLYWTSVVHCTTPGGPVALWFYVNSAPQSRAG